jgi:4-hydroxy-2-oxoheptanedioate aldolase
MTVSFAHKLRQKGGLLGSWCTFSSFASAELMTRFGFDFLILDLQHCELTQTHFPAILGAFHEGGSMPVVRAPQNDYHLINWLFDQGVPAVMIPMVNSVEDARRAVDASKYPPLGRRSFGPYRAAGYSFDAQGYMAGADERATLIVQIESVEAVRNLDGILATPGIDAVFAGPNDLAFSTLKPGQSFTKPSGAGGDGADSWTTFARNPETAALCEEIYAKAKAKSMPFGMTSGSIEEARSWLKKCASLMTFGSDFLFMRDGAKHLCESPESESAAGD